MALEINVTNLSNVEWKQWHWVYSHSGIDGAYELTKTPIEILKPYNGRTTANAKQIDLEEITRGTIRIDLGYELPASGYRFGVSLRQNFQEFTIGKGNTWLYLKGNRDNNWVDAGQDSKAVTWNVAGHKVTATPTLSHNTSSIEVLIN